MSKKNKRTVDIRLDRKEHEEITSTLKVSSYLGHVFNKVAHGIDIPTNMVPDMSTGMNTQGLSNEHSMLGTDRERQDSLLKTTAGLLGFSGLESAVDSDQHYAPDMPEKLNDYPMNADKPKLSISANQANAIKKYPAVVEFLGCQEGEKLANQIVLNMNTILAEKIGQNTKAVHKFAYSCVAERQNIKSYFVNEDENWVCCVVASGPFRGDEVFYYKYAEDKSYILRKNGEEYEDISSKFNIIHELAQKD